MVVVKNKIDDNKKYTSNAGNFDGHSYMVLQCGAHCLMERICGFMQSQYMPLLGECLHHITPAAAMVDNFEKKRKTLPKHNFYLAFSR
jgi:hypothetical protein